MTAYSIYPVGLSRQPIIFATLCFFISPLRILSSNLKSRFRAGFFGLDLPDLLAPFRGEGFSSSDSDHASKNPSSSFSGAPRAFYLLSKLSSNSWTKSITFSRFNFGSHVLSLCE